MILDPVVTAWAWPGHIRPDTYDLDVLHEIWVQDVYRARRHMQDARVLDLGANVGMFSIWAKMQGAREIIAVECCRENIEAFRANMGEMDGIDIRHHAIGGVNAACTASFQEYRQAGISHVTVDPLGDVKMYCLDTFIARNGDFDFVKVDIEGSEYETFQSASTETINRLSRLAIEFHGVDTPGSSPRLNEAFGELVTKLAETHCVHTLGHPLKGGYLYADLN